MDLFWLVHTGIYKPPFTSESDVLERLEEVHFESTEQVALFETEVSREAVATKESSNVFWKPGLENLCRIHAVQGKYRG